MTQNDALKDLDYIKSVALSGENAPLNGGRYGLFWGSLLCITFLAHWFVGSGAAGIDPNFVGAVWMAYGVYAVIGSVVLGLSMKGKTNNAAAQKVERHIWSSFAFALLALFIGVLLNILIGQGSPSMFDLVVPFAFAGYGMAYLTTAAFGNHARLRLPGYGSIIAAAVAMALYGRIELYLFAAVAIILVIVLPAIGTLKLERQHA